MHRPLSDIPAVLEIDTVLEYYKTAQSYTMLL